MNRSPNVPNITSWKVRIWEVPSLMQLIDNSTPEVCYANARFLPVALISYYFDQFSAFCENYVCLASFSSAELKKILERKREKKIPVVSVVSIMGTTEESAVDPLADILDLREEMRVKVTCTVKAILFNGAVRFYSTRLISRPAWPALSRSRESRNVLNQRKYSNPCNSLICDHIFKRA